MDFDRTRKLGYDASLENPWTLSALGTRWCIGNDNSIWVATELTDGTTEPAEIWESEMDGVDPEIVQFCWGTAHELSILNRNKGIAEPCWKLPNQIQDWVSDTKEKLAREFA